MSGTAPGNIKEQGINQEVLQTPLPSKKNLHNTVEELEDSIAKIEHAESAILFDSRIDVVRTTLTSLLNSGDHIVFGSDCNPLTKLIIQGELAELGIRSTEVIIEVGKVKAIRDAIEKDTKLIFLESLTNSYLQAHDIYTISTVAKQNEVPFIVDTSLANPINIQACERGADLVINTPVRTQQITNSSTSYLAGKTQLVEKVFENRDSLSVNVALTSDKLLTLADQTQLDNVNSLKLAEFFQEYSQIDVYHPGLKSHSSHIFAKDQMDGYGGVLTLDFNKDTKRAKWLVEYITDFSSRSTDSNSITAESISPNLLRIRTGNEDIQDVIKILKEAL